MEQTAATAPLLERSEELARIESALTEACSGRGRLVVIEGPAGIGKTALLDAARAAATESGMRVLRSRGTELEREFAFGVVRQLVEPVVAQASESERGDLLPGPAGVAAGLLGLAGARLERARTLVDLGAMLRRRNRRSQARELLREALDGAHRAGAARLAERAETELRATGARPRRIVLTGLDSLTPSERRIAELASQNLTNREIAQLLFITDRTVEGHLTSVFRKLQLDSRSELSPALAKRAPLSA